MSFLDLTLPLSRPRRSFRALLKDMASLHRQRHALANLDPHLLRDVGITPEEARIEAARPVWDAPHHWQG